MRLVTYEVGAPDADTCAPYGRKRAFAGFVLGLIGCAALIGACVLAWPAAADDRPLIAVVIDDVGHDAGAARRVFNLPAPVSAAFLPYAEQSRALAAEADRAGIEVMVHVPMEPTGLVDPGPGVIATWHSADEIAQRARAAFDQFPAARGFNNHMGSRFTACLHCAAPILSEARNRGWFVLDSKTNPSSQLAHAAQAAGLRTLKRDVFLDHEPGEVMARLAEAERIARASGVAVVIGHPHSETLTALEAWIPDAIARGFAVGSASEALGRERTRFAAR